MHVNPESAVDIGPGDEIISRGFTNLHAYLQESRIYSLEDHITGSIIANDGYGNYVSIAGKSSRLEPFGVIDGRTVPAMHFRSKDPTECQNTLTLGISSSTD